MARLNILDRFRPVGAPGPGGIAGIPADDDRGRAAELAPVFAALAGDIGSGRKLVEEAEWKADEELSTVRTRAAAAIAQARLDAGAARARAAAEVQQSALKRDQRMLAEAHAKSATLGAAGEAQLPAAVQKVIAKLLSEQLGS